MGIKPGQINLPAGLLASGVTCERHPTWYPLAENTAAQLFVVNSLTETKVPFSTRTGRVVKWYTCGPTVYDSAHMGHARAYITFDILRRIMEDHFGYHVNYQMNITDIDDKIIKRARTNFLLSQYLDKVKTCAKGDIIKDLKDALTFKETALHSARDAHLASLSKLATARQKDEHEEKGKEIVLKIDTFLLVKKELEDCFAKTANQELENGVLERILQKCKDVLGDWLDHQLGSTVNEHSIFEDHGRKYEREFMEDLASLHVRMPDYISRVTEYVPQIVSFIQRLMRKGFAYVGNTSVFFDLEAYEQAGHAYPKLKPVCGTSDRKTSKYEMNESEGVITDIVEGEKKNPNDFALWKFSKPGEPYWDSPWGLGRPGWHIECSAMASDLFGENFDIHAGGSDLKFPHHDNEIAQSEAYWGHHQWVNYFLHAGHLHIKGLKMAKSLKNFVTIKQALQEHTPAELRMMFLLQTWNHPMNFSDQTVAESREKLRVLNNFLRTVAALQREDVLSRIQIHGAEERELYQVITEASEAIHKALCNNFDTPETISILIALVARMHTYLETNKDELVNPLLLQKASRTVSRTLRLFGIPLGDEFLNAPSKGYSNKVVDTLVEFRDRIRTACLGTELSDKILAECDQLRDNVLPPLGIRLDDNPHGKTQWKEQDPAELVFEIERRKIAVRETALTKLQNRIRGRKDELQKWQKVLLEDPKVVISDEKYATWNAEGIPISTKDGIELSKSAIKSLKKEHMRRKIAHEELHQKGGEAYIEILKNDIEKLEANIRNLVPI